MTKDIERAASWVLEAWKVSGKDPEKLNNAMEALEQTLDHKPSRETTIQGLKDISKNKIILNDMSFDFDKKGGLELQVCPESKQTINQAIELLQEP